MTDQIKNLINENDLAYKSYCRFNRDGSLFEKFELLQNQLNVSIENSKQTCCSKYSHKKKQSGNLDRTSVISSVL